MRYVKLKSRSTIQGFLVTLAALLALSIGMVGLAGCSGGTSDEDAIRASLSSELDSIMNNVDGDSATAQITLTCKSYTGYLQALQTAVDELAATQPITITYTKVDGTWEPASSTSGDIAAALMTN